LNSFVLQQSTAPATHHLYKPSKTHLLSLSFTSLPAFNSKHALTMSLVPAANSSPLAFGSAPGPALAMASLQLIAEGARAGAEEAKQMVPANEQQHSATVASTTKALGMLKRCVAQPGLFQVLRSWAAARLHENRYKLQHRQAN
jgi:hypothetical protein